MTNFRFLDDRDFWLSVVRIIRGNPWHAAAAVLVFGGVATIKGVVQYLITPIGAAFGFNIPIPETPLWVSLLLIFLGIGMFVVSRVLPERLFRNAPSPHDIELMNRYRSLVTLPLIQFLRDVSFRNPFRLSVLDPIEVIADQWNGAHFEFHDDVVQAALEKVIEASRHLLNLTSKYIFSDYRDSTLGNPLTDVDIKQGISDSTRENIRQMNDSARELHNALNDFERLIQRRIFSR